MNRRGFTLIEIMVALVLSMVVLAVVYQVIIVTQRTTHAQAQRIELQQNLRSITQFAGARLRELDAAEGDLLVMNPDLIQYRGMQWAGFVCAPVVGTGNTVTVHLSRSRFFGFITPTSEHSAFIFVDGDVSVRGDDQWFPGPITAAVTGTCSDGSASYQLTVNVGGGNGNTVANGTTTGSPVRGWQVEEMSLFAQGGQNWLGFRAQTNGGTWGIVEPVAGPLQAAGLAFTYFDANGNVTATAANVTSVGLTVLGQTREAIRRFTGSPQRALDSLITHIGLRNNPRF